MVNKHSSGASSVSYKHSFLVVLCLSFDATDHYFYCLCQIVAFTVNVIFI